LAANRIDQIGADTATKPGAQGEQKTGDTAGSGSGPGGAGPSAAEKGAQGAKEEGPISNANSTWRVLASSTRIAPRG